MNIIGAMLISTFAGLSTMLGGLVIFFNFKEKNINAFITFALSFSLAIMIGISITDLIPESTYILIKSFGISRGVGYATLLFIIGVTLIHFLQKKINNTNINKGDLYKLGILNMLVLIIHNFPEGVATFMSSYKDISLGIKLAIAIAFHNFPEGISIAIPIYFATGSKKKALIRTLASGIAEPLGAIIAYLFLSKYITNTFISLILILVGGIMISLSIEVILPKAKSYKLNNYLAWGLLVGFGLIIINYFIFK